MNFNKYRKSHKKFDVKVNSSNLSNKKLSKLFTGKKKLSGRNNKGLITVWHRGGGHKRSYRFINFSSRLKNKLTFQALVRSVEYDPNRSSFISLLQTREGYFFYYLCTSYLTINTVLSLTFNYKSDVVLRNGNLVCLENIPIGVAICNIEVTPKSNSFFVRSAGTFASIIKKDLNFAYVKLPSGEIRLFDLSCTAIIGKVSNSFHKFHKKYKAGQNRFLNKRPHVRGVAMNPIDHPHGGGEGKTSGGRLSSTPWGKLTKGVPTSRNRNIKNKYILSNRKH